MIFVQMPSDCRYSCKIVFRCGQWPEFLSEPPCIMYAPSVFWRSRIFTQPVYWLCLGRNLSTLGCRNTLEWTRVARNPVFDPTVRFLVRGSADNFTQNRKGESPLFYPVCIRGTSHGPVSVCVCLSLCVCVRLSQAGVLLKRQNVGSHKQHHTIPQGF